MSRTEIAKRRNWRLLNITGGGNARMTTTTTTSMSMSMTAAPVETKTTNEAARRLRRSKEIDWGQRRQRSGRQRCWYDMVIHWKRVFILHQTLATCWRSSGGAVGRWAGLRGAGGQSEKEEPDPRLNKNAEMTIWEEPRPHRSKMSTAMTQDWAGSPENIYKDAMQLVGDEIEQSQFRTFLFLFS